MPQQSKSKLQSPGGSWESLKKIIRAYNAAGDTDNPTVEEVAQLAGLQRPVVSSNNNFLRSAGILEEASNKLTPVGQRLATGLGIGNAALASSALQEIVRGQEGLSYLINILKARSSMSLEAFRGEVVMVTGLDEKSRNLQFLKAIVDLLAESLLVSVGDDQITYTGVHIGETVRVMSPKQQSVQQELTKTASSSGNRVVPIPLGVGRLVNVELPEDWAPRDLPKLLKMLELSLSDYEAPKEGSS